MLAAIDAGGRKNVGWATSAEMTGCNLEELGDLIRHGLRTSRVVLAVEAPLWIPLRKQHNTMSSARAGEGQSWAGRTGAGALVSGLANLSLILGIAEPKRLVFDETNEPGNLVILEAYSPTRGATHIEVAQTIVKALVERWPDRFVCPIVRSSNERVLNLAAAVGHALGIPVSQSDLERETKVIDPCRLE
jgi:hypothetical protein